MYAPLHAALLSFFFVTSGYANNVTDMCGPPELKSQCGTSSSATFTINEMMNDPICLAINLDPDTSNDCIATNYTLFYPKIDEFTLLELKQGDQTNGGFAGLRVVGVQGKMRQIKVEVGGKTSTWKTRIKTMKDGSLVVPFYTLIIEMNKGQVKQLTWDDGCWGCENSGDETGSVCLEKKDCAVNAEKCGGDGTNCNVKVYIGWFGTDANGRYTTSAGKRISRFRKYSLADAYNTAKESTTSVVEEAGKTLG